MAHAPVHHADKSALIALMGIVIIFFVIVSRGWQTLFIQNGSLLSWVIGGVVALIAIGLARAIAAERLQNPNDYMTVAAYFFILFNISALGTINTMFVTFESGNVYREAIEQTTTTLLHLRDTSIKKIDTNEFDRFQSAVNERWRNFKAEIENPQSCGQGSVANSLGKELQEILPSFRLLSGGVHCEHIPELITAYEEQIATLMTSAPIYQRNREAIEFKSKLKEDTQESIQQLLNAQKSLTGEFQAAKVKGAIFDASEKYALLRQEVSAKVDLSTTELPERIDTRSVAALGEIGQVLPFLLSRLAYFSTYIYLLIALVLDCTVIIAFKRVLKDSSGRDRKHTHTQQSDDEPMFI